MTSTVGCAMLLSMAYETINAGKKITIAPITWRHAFEIGDLLKEKHIDNGYVALVVGLAGGWSDSYDVMVVKVTDPCVACPGPIHSIGDIVKKVEFSPEMWEKIDV